LFVILEVIVHELCPVVAVTDCILDDFLSIDVNDNATVEFVLAFETNRKSNDFIPLHVVRVFDISFEVCLAGITRTLDVVSK